MEAEERKYVRLRGSRRGSRRSVGGRCTSPPSLAWRIDVMLNPKALAPTVGARGYLKENKLEYPKGLSWEFKCDP